LHQQTILYSPLHNTPSQAYFAGSLAGEICSCVEKNRSQTVLKCWWCYIFHYI